MPSDITNNLIRQLTSRDEHGQHKYGTTLDRNDLTIEEWLQHLTEELLDGAGYAQCARRELQTLIGALTRIRDYPLHDSAYASAAHRMREIASNALLAYKHGVPPAS